MNWDVLGWVVAVILGVLFCATFVYAVCISAREWAISYLLRKSGVDAQAKISSLTLGIGGKNSARFSIDFVFLPVSYAASSEETTVRQQVSWRHYNRLLRDQSVSIQYLPSAPRISRLSGVDRDNTFRDSTTWVAGIAILAVFPLVILWIIAFLLVMTKYVRHESGA